MNRTFSRWRLMYCVDLRMKWPTITCSGWIFYFIFYFLWLKYPMRLLSVIDLVRLAKVAPFCSQIYLINNICNIFSSKHTISSLNVKIVGTSPPPPHQYCHPLSLQDNLPRKLPTSKSPQAWRKLAYWAFHPQWGPENGAEGKQRALFCCHKQLGLFPESTKACSGQELWSLRTTIALHWEGRAGW